MDSRTKQRKEGIRDKHIQTKRNKETGGVTNGRNEWDCLAVSAIYRKIWRRSVWINTPLERNSGGRSQPRTTVVCGGLQEKTPTWLVGQC